MEEELCLKFMADQTLTNIEKMKNAGMNIYKLKHNMFELMNLHEYTLPLPGTLIIIYDKIGGIITPIGVCCY